MKIKVIGHPIVYGELSHPIKEGLGPGFVEKIAPGAVPESVVERADIPLTIDHDSAKVIACTADGSLRLSLSPQGLFACAIVREPPLELLQAVKRGRIGASVAFRALETNWGTAPGGGRMRIVTALELSEVTLAARRQPAYSAAKFELILL